MRSRALLEVYELAQGITRNLDPDATFKAEQLLALRLAEWTTDRDDDRIELKAKVKIQITSENITRAEEFNVARRTATQDNVVLSERMEFLANSVLSDPTVAKIWWLLHGIAESDTQSKWQIFDTEVRPMINSIHRQEDAAAAFASIVTSVVERVHKDGPDQMDLLARMATSLLKGMGWQDLSQEVGSAFAAGQAPPAGATPAVTE
ncbi:hypothetical protein ACFXO9_19715 [Nocardia tengchongensis]|uniref:hypothetical protein n=1 Tax=Nocardia tengchongensis TaxID=2055889 RepID=UPI0036AA8F29